MSPVRPVGRILDWPLLGTFSASFLVLRGSTAAIFAPRAPSVEGVRDLSLIFCHHSATFRELRFSEAHLEAPISQTGVREDVTMIDMLFPNPVGAARMASLMVIFLLCLGTFLYPHQHAQLTTGHAFVGNYLAASIEETQIDKKHPLNAKYLTALLLTVFMGITLCLLLGCGRMCCRDWVFLLAERRLPSVTCSPPEGPTASLLSVFLL